MSGVVVKYIILRYPTNSRKVAKGLRKVAKGCERLRKVAKGCEKVAKGLRKVANEAQNPSTHRRRLKRGL
jgi:hypothetical protein